ncbi:MAG: GspJ family type II secretion system protein [Legionellaceae bacterium]|nr:GspJ family type II secretion system protein [Legionellaceae bacterium]
MKKKQSAFTLIELLIALSILAIMATLGIGVLYHSTVAQGRVRQHLDELQKLSYAISRLQQDTEQITDRSIRAENYRVFPAFIGQAHYMEFTRGGSSNPGYILRQSSLERIAFFCKNHTLWRRRFLRLDPISRNDSHDEALLKGLQTCQFHYLSHQLQNLDIWRAQARTLHQRPEPLPKAILLEMHSPKGKLSLWFPLHAISHA